MSLALRISLAGLALAAAFLAVIGGTSYFVLRQEIAGQLSRSLEQEAATAAAEIGEQFSQVEQMSRTLAANTLIANTLIDATGRESYLLPFLESFRAVGNLPVSVTLTDFLGRPIAANRQVPEALIPQAWVAEAIRREAPEAWITNTDAGVFLAISQPVILARTGSAEGALVAAFALGEVNPPNWRGRTHGYSGWLVEGSLEYDSTVLAPLFDAAAQAHRKPAPAASRAVASVPADPLLAPLRLGVLVSANPEALFAPLHRLERLFGIVGVVMAAVVTGVCFWGGRRLTDPLRKLEAVMRQVVDTQSFEHRAKVGGDGEISRLSTAFNQMLDRLAEDAEHRRNSEKALREGEARFRSLIDNAPAGIHLKSLDGRYLIVNDEFARYANAKAEDMVGKTSDNLSFSADVRARAAEAVRCVLETGNRQVHYTTFIGPDGKARDMLSTKFAIRNFAGCITAIGTINTDVTEYKLLQNQLVQAQKMDAIGQLTGGLSHDFNNLLAIIIGNLDLLEEDLRSRPDLQELAQAALGAALRGAELNRQLLTFARRQSLEAKVFDLNELAARTTQLLRRTLGEQIEIETMLSDDLQPALADPLQVETALANLAINARDAMPNGGRLTIETANTHLDDHYAAENAEVVPGDYVMLAVSDTGTGIPPESLSRVFEPFFTTKEQGKGTGLGLSMIYGFAKQSQGHVKIYSEVRHGTTVRLYLPKAAADVAQPTERPSVNAEPAADEVAILVVEDNPEVRSVVTKQLNELGYRVTEAENAASALEVLRQGQSFDLLFTDVVMPGGMTGIELAREAKRHRPTLRVLFTSGFAEASMKSAMPHQEIGCILSKPYRKEELARGIREALE